MSVTQQQVLAAIADLPGPDASKTLAQSGALGGVNVRDGKVFVSINVEPGKVQALEPMRGRVESVIKKLPGVAAAYVTLTAEGEPGAHKPQPVRTSGAGHSHGHSHGQPKPQASGGAARIGKIVAVASGKGGVGKSTTSANVALAFKKQGLKVGVLDADVYGPSMPRLFGIKGKPDMADNGKLAPKESFGVKVMSIGFLVQDEQPIVWRGPMVMSAIKQLLEDVEWGDLDVLVVDMPPGTGDAQLTLAQTVPLAGAIIVSTPQDLALIDARRGIAMFQQVHVPLVGVVENMSYFVCPHCGGRSDVFAHGGARHEAEKLGVPFLGEAPLHMSIRETSDAGVPVVVSAPDSPQANAYIDIARKAWENLTAGATGARPAPRIVVN
ncbi:MAG: Mrp/NBP35 family ATP-binding protein [Rhodoblastus sp.]